MDRDRRARIARNIQLNRGLIWNKQGFFFLFCLPIFYSMNTNLPNIFPVFSVLCNVVPVKTCVSLEVIASSYLRSFYTSSMYPGPPPYNFHTPFNLLQRIPPSTISAMLLFMTSVICVFSLIHGPIFYALLPFDSQFLYYSFL